MHDPLLGRVIDNRYRIDAAIGAGGMATVYRATRLQIGDAVAVKVLHAELLREPKFAERFRREAQAAAQLKHPNVVAIHDFGVSDDGVIYLVMELVEGRDLHAVIKAEAPMPPTAAAAIVRQVCSALGEAHRRDIVHRDIKPANIVVDESSDGVRVKVLDFGIASLRAGTMTAFTQTGAVLGTPAYMSPEQCLGEELDGRSDLYSLGVVLFEMLCGIVPFNSPTSTAVVLQHVQQEPPPLRVLNISVPVPVERVVLRALAKRREDRPQSARELGDELGAAVAGIGEVAHAATERAAAIERGMVNDSARTMVQARGAPSSAASSGGGVRVPKAALVVAAVAAVAGAGWLGVRALAPPSRAPASAAVPIDRAGPPAARAVVAQTAAPPPGAVGVPNRPQLAGGVDRIRTASAASEAVAQYYALWNERRFAEAYAMLSARYRAEHPYGSWLASHATVVTIGVQPTATQDPLSVAVAIQSADRIAGRIVDSAYRGTWGLVPEDGTLKLDHVALSQVQ